MVCIRDTHVDAVYAQTPPIGLQSIRISRAREAAVHETTSNQDELAVLRSDSRA